MKDVKFTTDIFKDTVKIHWLPEEFWRGDKYPFGNIQFNPTFLCRCPKCFGIDIITTTGIMFASRPCNGCGYRYGMIYSHDKEK
jgi:hypothetical protein